MWGGVCTNEKPVYLNIPIRAGNKHDESSMYEEKDKGNKGNTNVRMDLLITYEKTGGGRGGFSLGGFTRNSLMMHT
jgi:hypothetical protein